MRIWTFSVSLLSSNFIIQENRGKGFTWQRLDVTIPAPVAVAKNIKMLSRQGGNVGCQFNLVENAQNGRGVEP